MSPPNAPQLEPPADAARTARWLKQAVARLGVPAALMLAALPMLLFSGWILGSRYARLTRDAAVAESELARLAAATMQERLDKFVAIGVSLATRPYLERYVARGDWAGAAENAYATLGEFPDFESLFLADPAGNLRVNMPPWPGARGRNFAFREWYKGVSAGWRPYVSPAYQQSDFPRRNVISVVAPVRYKGRIVGILALRSSLSAFMRWGREFTGGSASDVCVMDQAGRLVYHPGHDPQGRIMDYAAAPVVAKALRGERGCAVQFDIVSRQWQLAAYEPLPKYGWAVVSSRPVALAFQERRRAMIRLGLLCLLSVFLTVLGAWSAFQALRQKQSLLDIQVAANQQLEAFSYSVAHDLRAPLRAIDGFSHILQEDHAGNLDAEGRRLLSVVRENTRRMGQLIDDLLAFSHASRKGLQIAELDMSALANSVLQEVCQSLSADKLRATVAPMPRAFADPALARQVLSNLVANAVKFSSKKPDPAIVVGSLRREGGAVYFVKDNGEGFDMRYADKLFGMFQRLHKREEFEGTGVGLAIVQRIILRHGGKVWAESRPGAGATFYFTLPDKGGGA